MTARVIGGSARGHRLKLVPGDSTRPIMDRVKENLFNLIGPEYLIDTRWLDLFAGTGSVGIEALSRGAAHVVFVDAARPAIRTIHDNLRSTRLEARATVRHADAFHFLERNTSPFDVIFVAPPQYHGMWVGALAGIEQRLAANLQPHGVVVVQIDPKEQMALSLAQLTLYKERTYGNTQLLFFAPRAPEAPPT